MEYNFLLEISHYEDSHIEKMDGRVQFIDYQNKHYRIVGKNGVQYRFTFDNLIEVKALEEYIELMSKKTEKSTSVNKKTLFLLTT